MVREIVTRSWCDLHMLHDERVEMTETHDVTLDGDAYTLDLCPEHVGAFESFASIVRMGSAKTKTPTKTTKSGDGGGAVLRADGELRAKRSHHERQCLACDGLFTSAGSFRKHLVAHHDADVGKMFGSDCPLCGGAYGSVQALGIHCSKTHTDLGSVRDVATAFQYAREHGDEHGIVRKRRATAAQMPEAHSDVLVDI